MRLPCSPSVYPSVSIHLSVCVIRLCLSIYLCIPPYSLDLPSPPPLIFVRRLKEITSVSFCLCLCVSPLNFLVFYAINVVSKESR
jgi:hypothetical protein